MLEELQKSPDELLVFNNDPETKQLVFEMNLTGHFSRKPEFADGQQSQQLMTYEQHPTHYIGVILYLGDPDPTENGYAIHCLPKSRTSHEEFLEYLRIVLNPTDDRIKVMKTLDGTEN